MAVHRRSPQSAHEGHESLKADLVSELKNPKAGGQPIILEDHTPQTDSIRVHVIWDRWSECDRALRSGIVTSAYESAFGNEIRRQITLALGLTVPEAIAVGLLPFQIVPARRKDGHPPEAEYRKAMVAAGASTRLGDEYPQLRFATLNDAEETLELLEQTLPNSKWIIVQEVPETTTSTTISTSTSVFPPPEK